MPNPPLGTALRHVRQQRGLTQKQAGGLIGYSASAISRIEHGGPIDVTTLIRLAAAYDIRLSQLGLDSVHDDPDTAEGRQGDMLRRQLLTMAGLSVPLWALTKLDDALAALPEPTATNPAATISAKLTTCRALYDNDQHTRLVAELPDLLAAAHRTAETTNHPNRWSTVASSYELATHLLSKLGRHDSSRLTADRAVTYARLSESPVAVALSSRALSIVLRHQKRPDLAQRINIDAITEIEKTGLVTPEQRTVFVQMLCSTAYAAANAADADRAIELTAEADRALKLLPQQPVHAATPVNATALTPAQAQLYKISMYCALGDSAAALEAARGLHPNQFPTLERQGRLLTDISKAWWLHSRPDLAGQALLAAHHHAPAEIADRPGVRRIATALIEQHPHLTEARRLRAALSGN